MLQCYNGNARLRSRSMGYVSIALSDSCAIMCYGREARSLLVATVNQ